MLNSLLEWLKRYLQPPKEEKIGINRRTAIYTGLAGGLGSILFRTTAQGAKNQYNPALIRPPGAVEEREFLARCIKCGECMKVCPTRVIQPAFLEAGLEGMWTPVMNPLYGYCEYGCVMCSQVCPTSAIEIMPLEEKQSLKMGQAFFDTNRCLPYAFGRNCMVCEEHCPTPEKSIWFEDYETLRAKDEKVIIKLPHVNPETCIGCGTCTYVCPIEDQPGIVVTSVGEQRHPDNQMLLTSDSSYLEDFDSVNDSQSPYGEDSPYGTDSEESPPESDRTDPYGGSGDDSQEDPYGMGGGNPYGNN